MRRRRWSLWLCVLLCLALTGCGTANTNAKLPSTATSRAPAPTQTPKSIALQSLNIGMTGVLMAVPGAAGIVLSQRNLAMGDVTDKLYFYRYSTKAVEAIATAPAPLNAIADVAFGGDWVAYVAVPGKTVQWQLWAYNVASGERIEIDSAAGENTSAEWNKPLRVSASHVVWSVRYPQENAGPEQWDTKVFDFSFAGRTTQLLASAHLGLLSVMAITDDAVLLDSLDSTTYLPTLYLLSHSGGSKKVLFQGVTQSDAGTRAAMNSQYVVWEDGPQDALTLYDLRAGQMTTYWAPCYEPEMSSAAPYVICMQSTTHTYALIHLPDATLAPYGELQRGSLLSPGPDLIYQNRVFHVTNSGEVQYFDLPTT